MKNRLLGIGTLMLAAAATLTMASLAYAHSSENDDHDDGPSVRQRAAQRLHWHTPEINRDPVVHIKLLGINDFHGQLSPKAVGARPAGGAAVLTSYLQAASAAAEDGALIIHAGDHIGASPPNSALLQDEPAISMLNRLANHHCNLPRVTNPYLPSVIAAYVQPLCNVTGTFGNHEFDEGIGELTRLLDGGNSSKGPFLESPWRGARFPYVSANVVASDTGRPIVPPYTVKLIAGVRIGIIGAVLKDTPTIVTPSGVAGLSFLDEATSINRYAAELRRQGVHTIVVTIHQGTAQTSYTGPTKPDVQNLTGPIIDIVKQLDDDIDVVISGHTHTFTNALVKNQHGKDILLTQAFSASTAYDDIDLSISRRTQDVVEKSAAIVTTWGDEGPGLTPDTPVASMVAAADQRVAPLVNRLIGVASTALTRTENAAGESTLGNLIADSQRTVTHAQFAFMNPGGIRADLDAGEVTWGDLFAIQPFSNDVTLMDVTGAQIKTLLEQQWQGQPANAPKLLKISGLKYTWDAALPIGGRIVQITDAQGTLLDPAATYRIAVNSFMATGGDNFVVLKNGTNRVVGPVDLDALVTYVQGLAQPFTATIEGRITRLN